MAAYTVQFSLSSEIFAPSYIHPPTLEPDWTNKRNFCLIYLLFIETYYQYIEMVLIPSTSRPLGRSKYQQLKFLPDISDFPA